MATTPRQRVTSMRWPANPSSAGRSVSDATTVMATTTAALTARPWMKLMPITTMPMNDTTTVTPAKATARPAVSIAIDVGLLRRVAVVEVLPVPGDDEQRVVDAHAEADHDRRGRERSRA